MVDINKVFIPIKFKGEIDYKNMSIPEKIDYIKNLSVNNIGKVSNKLTFDSFEIIKTHYNDYIFFSIYTLPQKNHPIIGFVSKKNITDKLILVRPIGKKHYNISIDELKNLLESKEIDAKEYVYALYLSIIKSIVIRKEEIFLDERHSLLNCNNIKGCITQTKKANISNNEKKTKTAEMRMNAINVLKKYFKFLEAAEFNLMFRSLKKLRGHIEIFISLYELVQIIIIYYKQF